MMNYKQRLFAVEYVKDFNATSAARRAGYSQRTASSIGSELLNKPEIIALVDKLTQQRAERLLITADYVITGIQETVERCKQAVPVLDKDGEPTGEYRFDSAAVLKGYELLGRYHKLFTDKAEISGPNGGPIDIHNASQADVDERIKQLERDLGLASAIDDAGRVGIAQAGAGQAAGSSQDESVLP